MHVKILKYYNTYIYIHVKNLVYISVHAIDEVCVKIQVNLT